MDIVNGLRGVPPSHGPVHSLQSNLCGLGGLCYDPKRTKALLYELQFYMAYMISQSLSSNTRHSAFCTIYWHNSVLLESWRLASLELMCWTDTHIWDVFIWFISRVNGNEALWILLVWDSYLINGSHHSKILSHLPFSLSLSLPF